VTHSFVAGGAAKSRSRIALQQHLRKTADVRRSRFGAAVLLQHSLSVDNSNRNTLYAINGPTLATILQEWAAFDAQRDCFRGEP